MESQLAAYTLFCIMEEYDSLAPFEVYSGSPWEAGLLLSILNDNHIECFQRDVSNLPWNIYPVRDSTVKVFVAFRDLEAAQRIVDEFSKNMQKEAEFDPEDES